MVEVTQADLEAGKASWNAYADAFNQWDHLSDGERQAVAMHFAAHRTATLQRVIDLANACVEQGIPLTSMIPMLEDMR